MSTVYILHNVDDWVSLHRNIKAEADTKIIALGSELQAYLKKNNIDFLTSKPFFSAVSHEAITEKSAGISSLVRGAFDLKDEFGLLDGYNNYFIFYLRFYINQISFLIEVILNSYHKLSASKIVVCSPAQTASKNIVENEYYKVLPAILETVRDNIGIPLECRQRRTKLGVYFFDVLYRFKKNTARQLMKFIFPFFDVKNRDADFIFVTSKKYNLAKAVEDITVKKKKLTPVYMNNSSLKEFFKLFSAKASELSILMPWCYVGLFRKHCFNSNFQKSLDNVINAVKSDGDDVVNYRGVSLEKFIILYGNGLAKKLLLELYIQTCAIDKMFNIFKPKAVLSQMALGWTFQLGELAANKNIPSLLISHGSHVASDSIYAQMEWKEHGLALTHTNYTHTVIQSPMAREYFTHNKVKSELLETGPLLFTKLQGKDKSKLDKLLPGQDGKFIIMHAGSARGIAARRFVVYETVDEYIENINSLIKVVENMSDDCFLIVRFRATEDLSLASLKELLIPSSKYSICAEGGFGDYLAITDVMVSYSSTTIDESLYNKIPVILFDSDDKYKHVPKAVSWKNFDNDRHAACCFASSEDELAETLSWFKNNYDLHQADWSQLMIESQPEKIRHLF